MTHEQIETLQEAGFTTKQIEALPDVYRLTSAQIALAVEIGALADEEEVPLDEMVQMPDDEIDYSDIPSGKEGRWVNAVVIPAKKTKRLVSVRLDPDVADYFQIQGKGYSAKINAVLRAYVDSQRAKEIHEAIRSGKMKTKPWAEVRAALKEKGLLDD